MTTHTIDYNIIRIIMHSFYSLLCVVIITLLFFCDFVAYEGFQKQMKMDKKQENIAVYEYRKMSMHIIDINKIKAPMYKYWCEE